MPDEDPTVSLASPPSARAILWDPTLPDGTVLDRFQIVRRLGAGGMGAVYEARDLQLDRSVALKLLHPGIDPERLTIEARALAKLSHPNVVTVHEVGRANGREYIAMELVTGGDLASWLAKPRTTREILTMFGRAGDGLAAAHDAGLVHRDFKPSNILVGERGVVRVSDFGLARSAPTASTTTEAERGIAVSIAGGITGTPSYMAPEQWTGGEVGPAADQFAFCVALWEALTGARPFGGETDEAVKEAVLRGPDGLDVSNVPRRLRRALLRGLAAAPADRWPTMDALLDEVRRGRRRSLPWIGGAAIVAIAATAVVVITAGTRDERGDPVPIGGVPMSPWSAILDASSLPPEQLEPLPTDPLGVTVHHLANGLTVMISPNHDIPRFRAMFRFHTGAGDAPGIAVLAAQMTEKGTTSIGTVDFARERPHLDQIRQLYAERARTRDPAARARLDAALDAEMTAASELELPDEHARVLTDLGSQWNWDSVAPHMTVFEMDLPSNRFAVWAELEADRFRHPVMRQFRAQVAELARPYRQVWDEFVGRLVDATRPILFANQPFGASARQESEAIVREPFAEVEQFIQQRYVPNNADLILAGDVDPVTAIPILARAFADWEPRALPPRVAPNRTPVAPAVIKLATDGIRRVSFHWVLSERDEMDPALNPLTFVLAQLLRDRSPVFGPNVADYSVTVEIGANETAEGAARAIDEALTKLRTGTVPDDVVRGAVQTYAAGRWADTLDNARRVAAIAWGTAGFDRMAWRDRVAHHHAAVRTTHADVVRLANAIFSPARLVVVAEPGSVSFPPLQIPKPPATRFATGRSARARALVERDVVPVQPRFLAAGSDYDERDIPGGVLVVRRDDKSQMFSLTVRFALGSLELPGICDILDARYAAMSARLAQHGLDVRDRTCHARAIVLAISGLDTQLPTAIEMLYSALEPPSDQEWANTIGEKRQRLAGALGRTDWIGTIAERYAMFGASELAPFDVERTRAMTPADRARTVASLRRAKQFVGYYGPRTADDVARLLPPPVAGAPPRERVQTAAATRPEVLLLDASSVTTGANVDIVFGIRDMYAWEPAIDLLTEHWTRTQLPGSQRLEAFASYPWQRRDDGYLALRVAAPTPADAAATIEQTLQSVLATPLEPAAFQRAKAARDEAGRSNWASRAEVPDMITRWRLLGFADDSRIALRSRWVKLSRDDVARFTAALSRAPRSIIVWGNLKGVDRRALSKYGALTERSIRDLVSPSPP